MWKQEKHDKEEKNRRFIKLKTRYGKDVKEDKTTMRLKITLMFSIMDIYI